MKSGCRQMQEYGCGWPTADKKFYEDENANLPSHWRLPNCCDVLRVALLGFPKTNASRWKGVNKSGRGGSGSTRCVL